AGTVPTAAAASCTAVTATGSRPASRPGWVSRKAADSRREPNTSASPVSEAPAAGCAATRPTPASAAANPDQARGPAVPRRNGTVVPQSRPAASRAARGAWRWLRMARSSAPAAVRLTSDGDSEIIFGEMAIRLDEIDVRLLTELQADADRSNVELARIVGLSP